MSLLPVRATPESMQLVRANYPSELLTERRWIAWDGTRKANGKLDKAPHDPASGRFASTTRPETWGTFEAACAFALKDERMGGVGFVLTDSEYWALDLDHVIDVQTRQLFPAAADFLEKLGPAYIELGPSRDGLHVLFRGRRPECLHRTTQDDAFGKGTKLEVFGGSSAKYLTATGEVWRP